MRAVYMYTAMADLAGEDKDQRLYEACQTLWDNIVKKRMYITGGIGSTVEGEAFTIDYDLPNDMAYAETCASIGMIFLQRECWRSGRLEFMRILWSGNFTMEPSVVSS